MMRQFITQMKAKGKENIDVQSLVERPNVYILGRCGAFKVEQLAYIKTRKACLQSLSEPLLTSNGAQITDDFFMDGPQQEFEAGAQKGGNAGCVRCSGDARKYKDLAVFLRRPHLSLSERLKKILQGPAGKNRRNGGLKPFKDLHVEELKRECTVRGLSCDGSKKRTARNSQGRDWWDSESTCNDLL